MFRSGKPFFRSIRWTWWTLSAWCFRRLQAFHPPDRMTAWSQILSTWHADSKISCVVSQRFEFSRSGSQDVGPEASPVGRIEGQGSRLPRSVRQTNCCVRLRWSEDRWTSGRKLISHRLAKLRRLWRFISAFLQRFWTASCRQSPLPMRTRHAQLIN